MKKLLTLITVLMLAVTVQAQKQVTTFLGIPVDGTKAEMKRKLIAKGFTPKNYGGNEFLEGEFNGKDVRLRIVTNNNKVYRIFVSEANEHDEAQIKTRYNTLVSQFENNPRYITLENFTLDESVNISYEMTVNNKRFEAAFYQKNKDDDNGDPSKRLVWFFINQKYGKYNIAMFYDNLYNQANGEDL